MRDKIIQINIRTCVVRNFENWLHGIRLRNTG
eukprot:Gb_13444 [translate_table: standard]